MSWFTQFLTSSIGRKLLMSLTGLFLVVFLLIHLIGNFQLLAGDGGVSFNTYAEFMAHNPLIQVVSKGLYFFILLHAYQGIVIWLKNRKARGNERYAVQVTRAVNTSGFAAKNMAWLGIIILVFLIIHMGQFWAKMKFGGETDLYGLVSTLYVNPIWVVFYVICMVVVGIHLWHGFQSSFQTMGVNHPKYSPLIRFVGKAYSILIPLGFAIIPIIMFLNK